MISLHYAAKLSMVTWVRSYLETGGDANLKDEDWNTALHYAVDNATTPSIAKLLLSHGANVNAHNKSKETPMHKAVMANNMTLVDMLIRAGASVNDRSAYGRTALMLSVEQHHSGITEFLLALGADPNIGTHCGDTPLMQAVEYDENDTVQVLLAAGADPNVKDMFRRTALTMLPNKSMDTAISIIAGGATIIIPKERPTHDREIHWSIFHKSMTQILESLPLSLQTIASFNLRMQAIKREFAKIKIQHTFSA